MNLDRLNYQIYPPTNNRTKVIITFLDEGFEEFLKIPIGFLDDLIGVITENKDGSIHHDSYLNGIQNWVLSNP